VIVSKIRLGERRQKWVQLPAGEYLDGDTIVTISVPVYVMANQTYNFLYSNLKEGPLAWRTSGYDWDTARTDEAACVPKLSWWRRLFGARIPTARVVSG
jgi:hypothetical protein